MSVDRIWVMSLLGRELMSLSVQLPVLWEDQDMAAGIGRVLVLTLGSLASCLLRLSLEWKSRAFRLVLSVSIASIGRRLHSLTEFADYIGNEQETQRNPSVNDEGEIIEAVSSNIDDRTMHEV
jgi:hypothetical protein